MTRPTNTGTQAVDRAAHLVATVVRADDPLTFSALEHECRLPEGSTTSRLLSALERAELLERDEAGSSSPARCSGCTRPATTRGNIWCGWPGRR